MRKYLLVTLAAATFVPLLASADIQVTSFQFNPASVAPSATTTAEITVDRQPNTVTTANDWLSYRIEVPANGVNDCVNVNHVTGASVDTETYELVATTTGGAYGATVKIYRQANCTFIRDDATTSYDVVVPPAPAPAPQPSPQSQQMTGASPYVITPLVDSEGRTYVYCPYFTPDPHNYCGGQVGTIYITVGAGTPSRDAQIAIVKQLIGLYWQVVQILQSQLATK